MSLLHTFLKPSGVRVHGRERGRLYFNKGAITFVKAPKKGMDSHLYGLTKVLVDQVGVHLQINSVDTGKHARDSRHYIGCAWDCSRLSFIGPSHPWEAATMDSLAAQAVVRWLVWLGFKHKEGGPWPCVLLGPAYSKWNDTSRPHLNHIHASIPRY